jgi:hypothetical protein
MNNRWKLAALCSLALFVALGVTVYAARDSLTQAFFEVQLEVFSQMWQKVWRS